MARGKQTCKILKEIRRQIAAANGIEYATSECRHKGDCAGTCPKCEAEVRYLEEQLRARSLSGKRVMLAGVSAGMLILSGCSGSQSDGSDDAAASQESYAELAETQGIAYYDDFELHGVVITPDDVYIFVTEPGVIADPLSCQFGDNQRIKSTALLKDEPAFPGGEDEMYDWIKCNISYPEQALAEGLSGSVTAEFVIDSEGNVCDVRVLSSPHKLLSREVYRVLSSMPKWQPGSRELEPYTVVYTMPFTFKLT